MSNDENMVDNLARISEGIATRHEAEGEESGFSVEQLAEIVKSLNSTLKSDAKLLVNVGCPEKELRSVSRFATDGKCILAQVANPTDIFRIRLQDIFEAVPLEFQLEVKDSKEAGKSPE